MNIGASVWLGLRGNVFTVAHVVQKQSGVRCRVGKGCLQSGAREQEPFWVFFFKDYITVTASILQTRREISVPAVLFFFSKH